MPPFVRKAPRPLKTSYIVGNVSLVRMLLMGIALGLREAFVGINVPLVKDRTNPNMAFGNKDTGLVVLIEFQYRNKAVQAFFDPIAERRWVEEVFEKSSLPPHRRYLGIDLCLTRKKEIIIQHGFILSADEES